MPNLFHDELIAQLFFEIYKKRAAKVLRAYHNKHLRMNTEDSSSFKTFVGLNVAEYIRLSRVLFYYAGMRILAPIKALYELRARKIKEDFTTLTSTVVDMTRKVAKGKLELKRLMKVVVQTIRPLECVLTKMFSLLDMGKLLKSTERFWSPIQLHKSFKDLVLWKVAVDAGGDMTKGTISCANVDKPQSLNHVVPWMEYTGKDYVEIV